MKIGILTLRLFKNYGGILQNYALSRFLQKNGYDVETINIAWSYQLNGVKKYLVWLKRSVRNVLSGKWHPLDEERILRNNESVAAQRINAFKEKNIPLSQKVYSLPGANFSDVNDKYDTIIVGSDQVWRPKYTCGIENYFLSFADDRIRKIAYSASFGTDKNEYSSNEMRVCGKLIKRFDAVSVREESAIPLIREQLHWDVDVIQTLDPTMLLDIADYKSLVGRVVNNNKIFVYVLDRSVQKMSFVEKLEKELCMPGFTITPKGMDNKSAYVMPPVETWLSALLESEFIFTDSFHGCVFSILFNKPFYVYGNKSRGKSRFDHLLKIFNLQERYLDEHTSLENFEVNADIDWNSVNALLQKHKERSKQFLLSALEK